MENNQNKYLEKFYKRNMSIDEIKNTYNDAKSNEDNSITKTKDLDSVYYLSFSQKCFLWLFFIGIIFRLHHYFI